jgi:L,D-transpeptidase ErfK/SrfK
MKRLTAMIWVLAGLCGPAAATVYELPEDGSAVFGADERVKSTYQDTLLDIARRYSLGYEEIIRANPGVDMWLPGEGTDILLPGRRILPPGPHEGVVVNLPEHRLYYFPKAKKGEKPVVITYPVSIGKMDWSTPLGETHVISKQKNPSWYPPESVRKEHLANGDPLPKVVPAGPDNPLGDFAMRLAVGGGSYMLHGTNNPMAVGMAITHGCIRMYPEDVAALFPLVPVGTKVWLINDPVKVAYVEGELLLEAHPPVDSEGQTTEPNLELLSQLLDKALGQDTAAIHWDLARETLQAANGIPAVVGLQAQLDQPPAPNGTPPPPATSSVQAPNATPPPAAATTPATPAAAASVAPAAAAPNAATVRATSAAAAPAARDAAASARAAAAPATAVPTTSTAAVPAVAAAPAAPATATSATAVPTTSTAPVPAVAAAPATTVAHAAAASAATAASTAAVPAAATAATPVAPATAASATAVPATSKATASVAPAAAASAPPTADESAAPAAAAPVAPQPAPAAATPAQAPTPVASVQAPPSGRQ